MSEYGLTEKGPNIKRLDVILEEMHQSLSDKLGTNTRQNPQSLMNHLLTDVADKLAELWELGLDVYYSQYPSSAEGVHLDCAVQYGGTTRGMPMPSYYSILCTGTDGTVLPSGTMISTDTNPSTQLILATEKTIERSNFNQVVIKSTSANVSSPLTVAIDEVPFSYVPSGSVSASTAITALFHILQSDGLDSRFSLTCNSASRTITIQSLEVSVNHSLILSENLTTTSVGTIVSFATEEDGDIFLPDGQVSKILKSVAGLQSVANVGDYIAGQLVETDTELRKSYVDKIYAMSTRMIESIRSAILDNVQGVTAVAVFENDSHEVDEMGRYPHSVEVVVDGGDASQIAQQILSTKAGGIQTYGSVEVAVSGIYGEDIWIRFNRPTYLYVWIQIRLTMSATTALPSNYADLIKEIILEEMESVEAGTVVIPQKLFTSRIYDAVDGVDYADFLLATTYDENKPSSSYTLRSVDVSPRERAVTSLAKIEVILDG